MPVQLPSFGSDVPDTVQRSLKALEGAVNALEPHMKRAAAGGDDAAAAELQAMRQQLLEATNRIDDLTRRIRALGG